MGPCISIIVGVKCATGIGVGKGPKDVFGSCPCVGGGGILRFACIEHLMFTRFSKND